MAQFARENKHSRIPYISNEQLTRQPGHQLIEAHTISHRASRTHQMASSTLNHSPEEAARFLVDALRDCPRQTGSRDIKSARSGAKLSLSYEHVTSQQTILKTEGSSQVLWRPTSCGPHTNATRHRRSIHANATGAEDSTGPTPGPQQGCLQPTNSISGRVTFWRF